MIKENKIAIINIILSIIVILLGIGLVVHGILFNEESTRLIEIYIGVILSIIVLIPATITFLGTKNKNDTLLLFSTIIYLMITVFLIVFFINIKVYNIVFSFIGIALSLSSLLNYLKLKNSK